MEPRARLISRSFQFRDSFSYNLHRWGGKLQSLSFPYDVIVKFCPITDYPHSVLSGINRSLEF